MKIRFLARLFEKPRLRKSDLLLTLLPALIWFAALSGRPYLMNTRCASAPENCVRASVFKLDRVSLGMADGNADELSFRTQDLSGYIASSLPFAWHLTHATLGRVSPLTALVGFATDTLILFQAVTLNGAVNEITRLIVQRPRPFVYGDPKTQGANPAHYTSFYSGHTSFAAAVMTSLVLMLLGRGAPSSLIALLAAGDFVLVFLTGFFRVLAGRHFATDVLAGALAGALIALGVALYHRKQRELGI
ncbi:phosphatase PAP2 family protein [Bdellovibrionota bacterium FG-2]